MDLHENFMTRTPGPNEDRQAAGIAALRYVATGEREERYTWNSLQEMKKRFPRTREQKANDTRSNF
ncbi:hypothetical protein PGS1_15955 [Enterobacter cloacae subsp. cloacae GS1]|nr:hypothetical protein PGS1_15955 [Enterobacter cloacae subsp. cloacae GS1]